MKFAGGLAAAFVVASLVPGPYADVRVTPMSNAILESAQLDPATVAGVSRTCGNCHSNLTEWPWYRRIAPVSWMVRKPVSEARRFMNFSTWNEYGPAGQAPLPALAAGQLKSGEMPPSCYLLLDPEEKLSDTERGEISAKFRQESKRLSQRLNEARP